MPLSATEERVGQFGDLNVDKAIAKADTLIEAMGWIRRFRGKTTVIKLGGSLVDDESALMSDAEIDAVNKRIPGLLPVDDPEDTDQDASASAG